MDRILATHVGSLIRPPELVTLLRAREEGLEVDDAEFAATLRASVADVVRRQAEAGIDVVSDGEFGKTLTWARYIRERLGGFEQRPMEADMAGRIVLPGTDKRRFPDFYAGYEKTQGLTGTITNWVCIGPVTYTGQEALERDIDDLKAAHGGRRRDRTASCPVVAPASVGADPRSTSSTTRDEEFVFAARRRAERRSTARSSTPA